jgi:hypothetical protein
MGRTVSITIGRKVSLTTMEDSRPKRERTVSLTTATERTVSLTMERTVSLTIEETVSVTMERTMSLNVERTISQSKPRRGQQTGRGVREADETGILKERKTRPTTSCRNNTSTAACALPARLPDSVRADWEAGSWISDLRTGGGGMNGLNQLFSG